MSKITIDKSKVIIDGHASDLETCNTLTNLCDELSKSDKFKTVRYENGYGEFESVSESEEKKFASRDGYIVENIVLPDSYSTLTALFSDIATVIREKTGDTASIVADDFPDVIRSSLQKKPQTETWYFNQTLTEENAEFTVSFTSNGEKFTSIRREYLSSKFVINVLYYDNTTIMDSDYWTDKYRMIVLDEPATGDLLTWLQANAVRQ